jgi:hypothetical protein
MKQNLAKPLGGDASFYTDNLVHVENYSTVHEKFNSPHTKSTDNPKIQLSVPKFNCQHDRRPLDAPLASPSE